MIPQLQQARKVEQLPAISFEEKRSSIEHSDLRLQFIAYNQHGPFQVNKASEPRKTVKKKVK
jgi:hypothetical protein